MNGVITKIQPFEEIDAVYMAVHSFSGISALFWYNDYIYKLPTPVPKDYVPVPNGRFVQLPAQLPFSNTKPVFLHFFNPDCPCSKFNMRHFRSLVKQYGRQVQFVVVVMNNDRYSEEEIQNSFGVNLPVIFDMELARECGVYSTPQAVILNNNHELYYRGNYNKNRYCTDAKTNYAQIALNTLLTHSRGISFDQYALTAYGCQVKCFKN